MLNLFHKKLNSSEFIELKTALESLKIQFKSLELELELVIKKLKFKYKISNKDPEETQDLKNSVLLPDNGLA